MVDDRREITVIEIKQVTVEKLRRPYKSYSCPRCDSEIIITHPAGLEPYASCEKCRVYAGFRPL